VRESEVSDDECSLYSSSSIVDSFEIESCEYSGVGESAAWDKTDNCDIVVCADDTTEHGDKHEILEETLRVLFNADGIVKLVAYFLFFFWAFH